MRTDRIVLKIGEHLLNDLRALTPFIETHTGVGHEIFVARHNSRQTVVCTCGLPGAPPKIALVEDEIIDDG